MGPHGRPGRREPGPLRENEGGWSIPEAAGARGCLLGCAGPTRSSFWAATSAEGRTGKGPRGRGREAQPDPTGGLPQTLEGRAQDGRGPLEVRPTPSLAPVLPGLPWKRHAPAGGRQALAGEGEMP